MIIEPHFDYMAIDQKEASAECPLYSNSNISSIESKGGKNGRWTNREHQLFVDALSRYGKSWKKVEDHIGTRSGAQIRSHAQKFFNRLEREQSKPFNGLKSVEIKEIFEEYEDVKLKRQKKLIIIPEISPQRKMEQDVLEFLNLQMMIEQNRVFFTLYQQIFAINSQNLFQQNMICTTPRSKFVTDQSEITEHRNE